MKEDIVARNRGECPRCKTMVDKLHLKITRPDGMVSYGVRMVESAGVAHACWQSIPPDADLLVMGDG